MKKYLKLADDIIKSGVPDYTTSSGIPMREWNLYNGIIIIRLSIYKGIESNKGLFLKDHGITVKPDKDVPPVKVEDYYSKK